MTTDLYQDNDDVERKPMPQTDHSHSSEQIPWEYHKNNPGSP